VLAEEGLKLASEVGFQATVGHALAVLSLVNGVAGDPLAGREAGDASLATPPTLLGTILANWGLALAHSALAQYEPAWWHIQEALRHAECLPFQALVTWPLPVAAFILGQVGATVSAVEVLSFACNHALNVTGWTEEWDALAGLGDGLRGKLGSDAFEAAWERGKSLHHETLLARLLAENRVFGQTVGGLPYTMAPVT
jgi:hypothetical protein